MSSKICNISELAATGAKSIELTLNEKTVAVFTVEKDGHYYTYLDSCPHTGAPLPWTPDDYFDITGEYLICALHGALFRMSDGYCIAGPCSGQSLQAIPIKQLNNEIHLDRKNHT